VPLVGDVVVREVAGPLEKESGGVAVEGVTCCDCEGRRRRGGISPKHAHRHSSRSGEPLCRGPVWQLAF
jgi:hypothetical protein